MDGAATGRIDVSEATEEEIRNTLARLLREELSAQDFATQAPPLPARQRTGAEPSSARLAATFRRNLGDRIRELGWNERYVTKGKRAEIDKMQAEGFSLAHVARTLVALAEKEGGDRG